MRIKKRMRGRDKKQAAMFTLVSPETAVPTDHPLREVKRIVDEILRAMSPTFRAMYADDGRPSIAPERLLKGMLLMALYSVRSERLFAEELSYNLLFKWFLDMSLDERAFDASTFSKNRERMLEHDIAGHFFRSVVEHARSAGLMSDEHFTVDGTLIEANAALKSLKRRDSDDDDDETSDGGTSGRNPEVSWHGQKRSNETHVSKTDPGSRLARKANAQAAKLSFSAHSLMENRSGLLVDFRIAPATGTAERDIARELIEENVARERGRTTVGADKAYDTRQFVEELRALNVTPHVSQNTTGRRSAIDERTTRHSGYRVSQVIRKRVEEFFGWAKTIGGLRRTRFRGIERTQCAAYIVGAAYNLLRIARLA